MPTLSSDLDEAELGTVTHPPPPTSPPTWLTSTKHIFISELRAQRPIAVPIAATNLAWFAKTAVTTAFLGRLGALQLAGGTLGFSFANVTGLSVLTGLCGAMEPICGQAYGAGNHKLLHKTLLMAILLLLATSLPISFLWLNVERVLIHIGQKNDIAQIASKYVIHLLPDLIVTCFLSPLKSYLSSQGVTLPTLFSTGLALAFHVPLNFLLSNWKGIEGVAMAVWLTDLVLVLTLAPYVIATEVRRKTGWWLEKQRLEDWIRLLRLSAPCCLTTCMEWWCVEILVLLAGRLPDARKEVAVFAVVLNFDYLLFSVMLSLATSVSTRVSNELGAGRADTARRSAFVSIGTGFAAGVMGCAVMIGVRGRWGALFSHDRGVVEGVRRMMVLMAAVEVVNFPLAVCGGIVRGTARPWLGMYASVGGFYVVALPVAVVLAFRVGLGLGGLLLGFLAGAVASVALQVVFVAYIDWVQEARKAEKLAGQGVEGDGEGCEPCDVGVAQHE